MSAIHPGIAAWKYQFEITPIILTGGIAGPAPGAIPIINFLMPNLFETLSSAAQGDPGALFSLASLAQTAAQSPRSFGSLASRMITGPLLAGLGPLGAAAGAALSDIAGFDFLELDNYFAHFRPIPGTTLSENQLGEFPFANQATAANAIIRQPLTISMLMVCPVGKGMTYWEKFQIMSALKLTLDQHDNMGGTYTVMTPTFAYDNCIKLRLVDISSEGSEQPQVSFQWDFRRPLITLEQVTQSYNNYMGKIASQVPQIMNSSGEIPTSGISTPDTSATVTPNTIGSAANLPGATLPAADLNSLPSAQIPSGAATSPASGPQVPTANVPAATA